MKKKQELSFKIAFMGIVAIFLLEMVALVLGFDGQILRLSVALIAGLAGFTLPAPKVFKFLKRFKHG